MVERVEELEFEACRLAGKRLSMMAALKFLAARGNNEAQGFLDALEYEHAKPAEGPDKRLPTVKPGTVACWPMKRGHLLKSSCRGTSNRAKAQSTGLGRRLRSAPFSRAHPV